MIQRLHIYSWKHKSAKSKFLSEENLNLSDRGHDASNIGQASNLVAELQSKLMALEQKRNIVTVVNTEQNDDPVVEEPEAGQANDDQADASDNYSEDSSESDVSTEASTAIKASDEEEDKDDSNLSSGKVQNISFYYLIFQIFLSLIT